LSLPPRPLLIAGSVVLLHVGVLWALQTGLLRHAIELVVPVTVLSEIIPAPQARVEPPPPAPKPVPRTVEPVRPRPTPTPTPRSVAPAPQPVAVPDPSPAPDAPTGRVGPQEPAPPVAAAAPPSAAPPAPARVELPSSDADYLQNPKPVYPPMSKRLGEQGKVIVRVFIGADGAAQRAEISRSSGFDRLDQAALATVLKWRYVPGKRGGVPEAMWFNVPINFVLE
jgi:protein TonB